LVYESKQLDTPGLQPLRQELLKIALRFYKGFAAEHTNDVAAPSPALQQQLAEPETLAIEILGRTQCTPTRKADIAPVPLHPVNEVLVEPGSRVKKGQALVKLDDDEQQAEVRAKQVALENTKVALTEAHRQLAAIEPLYKTGALAGQRYHEVRVAARTAELNEQAAQAALDFARAELEHYEVKAVIDGVVSWLEVHPGMVSRPGTTTWGEIVDLQEIDVRCEMTLEQADRLAVGQPAGVSRTDTKDMLGTGQVIFMGITADEKSSLVPVVVRLPNPQGRLRCGEPVNVHLIIAGSSSHPDLVRKSACWGQ
jgi:RND family efflux transporter MFP subunit